MKLGKETEAIEYKKSTDELKEGVISVILNRILQDYKSYGRLPSHVMVIQR